MSKGRKSLPWIIPCLLAAFLAGSPASALGAIRYVNASRPDDFGDGLSWATAKKTLQAALGPAGGGDQVWVAAGIYKPDQGGGQTPGNRLATFHLKNNVAIYGGFAGAETSLSQRDVAAHPTILSGDLSGNDVLIGCSADFHCDSFGGNCLDGFCNIADNNGENSFHVVRSNGVNGVLDGFTITAGNANGAFPEFQGGGIYITGSTPTISNCILTRNSASSNGGGAHNASGGGTFKSCMFNGNSAGNGGGGGLYNSGSGGDVVRCMFRGNVGKGIGGGAGGGLYNVNSSNIDVVNCIFLGNEGSTGGGMSITNNSTGNVVNCLFSGNRALAAGGLEIGATSTPTLSNCAFVRNIATTGDGGGIRNSSSNPFIFNSIFWENSDTGGMDSSAQIHVSSGAPNVNYNIIQGGWVGGSGNSSANPLFVDADGPDNLFGTLDDNVRVMPNSPAIDSGHTGALPSDSTDLDGDGITMGKTPLDLAENPRQADDPFVVDSGQSPTPIVDMGPYERLANVVYVDASATGANNGSTWADAFLHLQSALSFASTNPAIAEIWVADGTYMPDGGRTPVGGVHVNGTGNRTATFQLDNGVSLYGGFAGGETILSERNPAANFTILSGDLLGDDEPVFCTDDSPCLSFGRICLSGKCIIGDNNDENSYHVVSGGSGTNATAVLDGFVISAGNANSTPNHTGGGLNIVGGSPTIIGCTFTGNRTAYGGAIKTTSSNSTLSQCTIQGNEATINGGGIWNEFSSSFKVSDCIFRGNSTSGRGGGMYNVNNSTATVTKCIFARNLGLFGGGGLANTNGATALITNCAFTGNLGNPGGGIFSEQTTTVVNSTFSGNVSTAEGGGLYHSSNSSFFLTNCTFSGNIASTSGGAVYNTGDNSPDIVNAILWNNSDAGGMDESAQVHTTTGTLEVSHSILQGGWTGFGTNNSNADPLFFDPDGMDEVVGTIDDNLRLRTGSPAINTGDNARVPTDTSDLDGDGNTAEQTPIDLAGEPRFLGSVDRGAYEYFPDCNNNGVPDSTDIALGTSQDCDSNAVWHSNGIPDECDIANCSELRTCVAGPNTGLPCTTDSECPSGTCTGPEPPACQDCNLNGVPDRCDIAFCQGGKCFFGTPDVNPADGVPDECGYFTGNCILPQPQQRYWTCPDNWTLNGFYPDDDDSAAGISVTLPAGAVVFLDEKVSIPNLYIRNGAEILMTDPTGNGDIDVGQAIQVEGTLRMAACKLAANTPPRITVEKGGKIETTPCQGSGPPSTIVSAEIQLLGNDCFTSPCLDGGRIDLDESISLTCTGDLVIDGSLANGSCDGSPLRDAESSRLSDHAPPSFNARGSSTTIVIGGLYLIGAAQVNIDSEFPMELNGDFENQSVRPDCFHWTSGALTMNGTGQEFEVAATDLGVVDYEGRVAGGGSLTEFTMGAVTIAAGASVKFRDSFDNNLSGQGPCSEALYLGRLVVEAGASLTIENCRVYYATLSVDPSATVSLVGCAELVATPIVPPPHAQADASGVNKTRFISFSVPTPSAAAGETALRVRLESLHHVVPAYTGGPSVPFTSIEGQVRWVGPPMQYQESTSNATPFFAANLQCTPYYQDWSTVGLLHVTGSAIVPSSIYEVENVGDICQGFESNCTAVSTPLAVRTTRWGDVEVPYNPPSTTAQPDLGDIATLVSKFRSAPNAPIKARALLAGDDALGNFNPATLSLDFGFGHIAACVDAFRGRPYPHTIAVCP